MFDPKLECEGLKNAARRKVIKDLVRDSSCTVVLPAGDKIRSRMEEVARATFRSYSQRRENISSA